MKRTPGFWTQLLSSRVLWFALGMLCMQAAEVAAYQASADQAMVDRVEKDQ